MSAFINESLLDDEHVNRVMDLHWAAWFPVAFFCGLAALASVFLLIPAAFFAANLLSIEQGLTTRRVISKRGVIGRNSYEMKLVNIENISVSQSPMGRILGYGDLLITGTGSTVVVLNQIADPVAVKRDIEIASQLAARAPQRVGRRPG